MSHSSIHPMDPNWSSTPFAKFSHNTSPAGTRQFIWNHVGARNDLGFVLRNARVADENGNFHTRILMKINAGAEELESQDLGELLQYTHTPGSLAGENLVQVVVKPPFIAMRYPKPGNLVRRIQLKFHNDTDYTRAMTFLQNLGLPVTDTLATAASIVRPGLSPSPSLLSNSSASTSFSVPLIMSSSSVSSSGTRISLPNPGTPMHSMLNLNSVDRLYEIPPEPSAVPEFKVPIRPNSIAADAQRPAMAARSPYASNQALTPATMANTLSVTPSILGLDMTHNLMSPSASLYLKQMGGKSPGRTLSYPILPIMKSSQDSYPDVYSSQIVSQQDSSPVRAEHPERQLAHSPFFPPRNSMPGMREIAMKDSRLASDENDIQRSTTHTRMPESEPRDELSRLWIPPKRVLPFPKPRETSIQRSASEFPSSSKNTPILPPGFAALAASTTTSTTAPKPIKQRVAQRKAPAAKPTAKASEIAESPSPEKGGGVNTLLAQIVPSNQPSPLAAKSAAATGSRPSSAASRLQSKAAAPKKRAAPARPASVAKRPKMVDQFTQTQNSTSTHQLLRNDGTQTSAASSAPSSTPTPPSETYLDTINAFVTKHEGRPRPQELFERPGYHEMDEEERQLLLNNFICENLENAEFIQLCEDTSKAWRRIALGK